MFSLCLDPKQEYISVRMGSGWEGERVEATNHNDRKEAYRVYLCTVHPSEAGSISCKGKEVCHFVTNLRDTTCYHSTIVHINDSIDQIVEETKKLTGLDIWMAA
jgi:hypothetical protein